MEYPAFFIMILKFEEYTTTTLPIKLVEEIFNIDRFATYTTYDDMVVVSARISDADVDKLKLEYEFTYFNFNWQQSDKLVNILIDHILDEVDKSRPSILAMLNLRNYVNGLFGQKSCIIYPTRVASDIVTDYEKNICNRKQATLLLNFINNAE